MKNTNVLIIWQYNVHNEKIRTMISLFVDKNIQYYDVIAIQKSWRNSFTSISLIEWSSGWVEPELGRPTLGLGRVEHTLLARADRTGWGFCPNGSNGLRFLSGRITRARTFVRRVESNRHTCPSSTQPEFRFIQKSRIGLSNRGLNSQFCPTGWAGQAILSDELTWVSSFVRARALD
jgi:hypothetical protein